VNVVCEAFGCLPSQAEREMERCAPGWIEEVLEARQYAEAYHMVAHAKNAADLPASPMTDLVQQIDAELAVDAYRAKKAAKKGTTHG
jgi:hypothetical protein